MPRKGNNNCCVVGCTSRYGNTPREISFYSFPPNDYINKDRRVRWIAAIRKMNRNKNKLWEPTKYSKVCSKHFPGGKRSFHPQSPAFIPTISPNQYEKNSLNVLAVERFERLRRRQINRDPLKKFISTSEQARILPSEEINSACSFIEPRKTDIGCQTESIDNNLSGILLEKTFVCNRVLKDGICEAETQTDLLFKTNCSSVADKSCGVSSNNNQNCLDCSAFHGYESIKNENELKDLTGVAFDTFNHLLELLGKCNGRKISMQNKLLICLIRIKCNLSCHALSVIFNIHVSTVSRIFLYILTNLAVATKNYIHWPSKFAIEATMPICFKKDYPQCRVIIDCTEMKVEQPALVENRNYLYSNYKGTYTAKVLIGISPVGTVTFLSKVYGGRSSDTFITVDSGILEKLEAGDTVLADKGFPNITTKENVIIVMPPRLHEGHLTTDEAITTYNIASVRIHVERVIQRIKIYKILKGTISNELFPHLDNLMHVCCVLANFQTPIIKEQ